MKTKPGMLLVGASMVGAWCRLNGVDPPRIEESEDPRNFATCAYYRNGVIYISVGACAAVGVAGMAWSAPGYTVDRTPYGVLAHELGHHVDGAHGSAGGRRSHSWREETREEAITTYAPNSNEWFAEIFRVFVTNPDLLSILRPKTFHRMQEEWPARAESRTWREVLAEYPRQLRAAENKVRAAGRK